MRIRQAAIGLLAIAAFCGYLVTACTRMVPEPSVHADAPRSLLLSQPAIAENIGQAAVPPPPPAPASEPSVPIVAIPVTPVKPTATYHEVWAVVTAYCPCRRCCGRHANGRTSTGTSAWLRGIAADPHIVPYGTRIYVEGYGVSKVDDTGGAMRRSWRRSGMIHVDLRMTYHYQARRWGRKIMKIRIYDK